MTNRENVDESRRQFIKMLGLGSFSVFVIGAGGPVIASVLIEDDEDNAPPAQVVPSRVLVFQNRVGVRAGYVVDTTTDNVIGLWRDNPTRQPMNLQMRIGAKTETLRDSRDQGDFLFFEPAGKSDDVFSFSWGVPS